MTCRTFISSDRSSISVFDIKDFLNNDVSYDITVSQKDKKLSIIRHDIGGEKEFSFPLDSRSTSVLMNNFATNICENIIDQTRLLPPGEGTCLPGYAFQSRISNNISYILEEKVLEDGRKLRENYNIQMNEQGLIDYASCRETEALLLSPAGAAYAALDRIQMRCEPIEANLPKEMSSGYSMGADVEAVFRFIRSQMSREDFDKIREMRREET